MHPRTPASGKAKTKGSAKRGADAKGSAKTSQRGRRKAQAFTEDDSDGDGDGDESDGSQRSSSSSRRSSDCEDAPSARLYDPATVVVAPAYDTKHLPVLVYPLPSLRSAPPLTLSQSSTSGSTSSSLWLSAQVLAAYILAEPSLRRGGGRLAMELGAGTGFLSLVLGRCGWDVVATDLREVVDGVLGENVRVNIVDGSAAGPQGGTVSARELDWLAVPTSLPLTSVEAPALRLVLASDTLYAPALVPGFFRAFSAALAISSAPTLGLLALERRDPALIEGAMDLAVRECGLRFRPAVREKKLVRIVREQLGWRSREVWEAVELWEVRLADWER